MAQDTRPLGAIILPKIPIFQSLWNRKPTSLNRARWNLAVPSPWSV